jgi:hypothetical protein
MGEHVRRVSRARSAAVPGVAVVAMLALSGGSALAATPAWTLVSSPNVNGVPQDNFLGGVSCVGTSFCVAVGYINGTSTDKTLIQKWNGTSWATLSSPHPGTGSFLNAVSCVSTSFCMAVGSYGTRTASPTLVEKWNGSKWSMVTSPNPGTPAANGLDGVSCASPTSCVAVGSSDVNPTATPLAEKWNGTSWTLTTLPDDALASSGLNGVSCPSATFCLAVGVGHTGASEGTFADKWNGTTWTLVPYQSAGKTVILNGVTCTSTTFCMAVGSSSDNVNPGQTLTAKWNGKGWKAISSPDTSAAQNNQLNAVSCTSSSFCAAVGLYDNGGHYPQTLAQKWNGASWTITKSPNTSSVQDNELSAVSCTSASLCMSGGYHTGSTDNDQLLAQKWNGTSWSKTTIESAGSPSDNYLSGVSCAGTAFCMAVGSYSNGLDDQATEQKWNGTSWATVASNSTSQSVGLNGVSCVSASFCMAVGTISNGTAGQNVAEKWNGSKWAKVAVPDTSPTADNDLSWVNCTSTTFCLAVGAAGPTSQRVTLAQKWNGTSWTMRTSPDPGTATNDLSAVSCPSTTFCMAVGFTEDTASPEQTLIVKWNGSGLASVTSANKGNAALDAVSCTSSTFCMAAGYYSVTEFDQTLAQKWNGTHWTLVTSPDKGTGNNELNGVSCASTAFCMGAGDYRTAASLDRTLIEKW